MSERTSARGGTWRTLERVCEWVGVSGRTLERVCEWVGVSGRAHWASKPRVSKRRGSERSGLLLLLAFEKRALLLLLFRGVRE